MADRKGQVQKCLKLSAVVEFWQITVELSERKIMKAKEAVSCSVTSRNTVLVGFVRQHLVASKSFCMK